MGQFQGGPAHLAAYFNPKGKQVGDHGGPDLDQDGILRGPVKSFDFRFGLIQGKKSRNLPMLLIEVSHRQGGQEKAPGR
jgi:hypothetical protein